MMITPPTRTKNMERSTTDAKNFVAPSNRPPSTVSAVNAAMSNTREPMKREINEVRRKKVLIPLVKRVLESILCVKE